MTRTIPEKCDVCGLVPPARGVGFPCSPGAIPGLPDHLRGACIWICHGFACDLAAQKRATAAAAKAGFKLKTIARVLNFAGTPTPKEPHT